jgi:hypothetical protein
MFLRVLKKRESSAGCNLVRIQRKVIFTAVLRIRIWIHRIHMFLGLPDLDTDPLVRGMDPDPAPDPDPSIIMQK